MHVSPPTLPPVSVAYLMQSRSRIAKAQQRDLVVNDVVTSHRPRSRHVSSRFLLLFVALARSVSTNPTLPGCFGPKSRSAAAEIYRVAWPLPIGYALQRRLGLATSRSGRFVDLMPLSGRGDLYSGGHRWWIRRRDLAVGRSID